MLHDVLQLAFEDQRTLRWNDACMHWRPAKRILQLNHDLSRTRTVEPCVELCGVSIVQQAVGSPH